MRPIFLPRRSSTRKMSSRARTNKAPPSYTCVAPEQPGPADVGVDVDRRIQPTESHQVVEVVHVVRVPVVLGRMAEVGVLDAQLLELPAAPAQFLVDVVGRHHRAVREPHLVPIQWNGGGDLLGHRTLLLGARLASSRGGGRTNVYGCTHHAPDAPNCEGPMVPMASRCSDLAGGGVGRRRPRCRTEPARRRVHQLLAEAPPTAPRPAHPPRPGSPRRLAIRWPLPRFAPL